MLFWVWVLWDWLLGLSDVFDWFGWGLLFVFALVLVIRLCFGCLCTYGLIVCRVVVWVGCFVVILWVCVILLAISDFDCAVGLVVLVWWCCLVFGDFI